jgi:hypothetical protein
MSTTLTVPAKRHTLTEHECAATAADWVMRAARCLDPSLPARSVGAAGQVARVLLDNARRHGQPPVTVEVAVSTVLSIEVTDHGAGTPMARPDGTGSLAVVVGELASLWDVTEHDDCSKTVTAMVPIIEEQAPRARKRVRR